MKQVFILVYKWEINPIAFFNRCEMMQYEADNLNAELDTDPENDLVWVLTPNY